MPARCRIFSSVLFSGSFEELKTTKKQKYKKGSASNTFRFISVSFSFSGVASVAQRFSWSDEQRLVRRRQASEWRRRRSPWTAPVRNVRRASVCTICAISPRSSCRTSDSSPWSSAIASWAPSRSKRLKPSTNCR